MLGSGFFDRFCKSEVERRGEELVTAVERPRLQQLLGANHAERVEQLEADDVLSALAAIERQIRTARVIAARDAHNQRRVFVIRMRAGVHQARGGLQSLQHLDEPERAAAVDRTHLRRRRRPHQAVRADQRDQCEGEGDRRKPGRTFRMSKV